MDHNYVPAEIDLTKFTRLHSLCASWVMLWPDAESLCANWVMLWPDAELLSPGESSYRTGAHMFSTKFDIRDRLPRSLRNLDLSGVFANDERENLLGPFAAPNEQTPDLAMEGIRVLTPGATAEVDGWDESGVTKIFGGGDGVWVKNAWGPCAFAHIIDKY